MKTFCMEMRRFYIEKHFNSCYNILKSCAGADETYRTECECRLCRISAFLALAVLERKLMELIELACTAVEIR